MPSQNKVQLDKSKITLQDFPVTVPAKAEVGLKLIGLDLCSYGLHRIEQLATKTAEIQLLISDKKIGR